MSAVTEPSLRDVSDGLAAALAAMVECQKRAASAVGESMDRFELPAGHAQFAIAGRLLRDRLLDVLRHLAGESGCRVRLRASLWDCAESGVPRPLPDVRRLFDRTAQFGDGVVASAPGFRAYQSPRLYALIDLERGMLAACVPDACGLAAFDIGKPLLPVLLPWYQHNRVQPLHAALVAHEGRGVLIGGKGGSGKSTTALACAKAGFDFLGDDYVGVGDEGEPLGYSFYGSAWLETAHSRTVGGISDHRLPGIYAGERKDSFSVSRAYPGRLARTVPISALAIPRVSGDGETRVARLASADALLRLAPSSVLQTPFLDPQAPFRLCGQLVRRLPCFELRLGRDRDSIPEGVRALLREAAA